VRIRLFIAVCAAVLTPALASATTPRVVTLDRATFTVHGVGFAATERVRVVATTPGDSATKWTRTGSLGGFTVAMPTFTFESCTGFVVRAFGATGDRATLIRRPPECPAPLTP
jgi:hypothetical protein